MATLDTFTSPKGDILAQLFGESWKELLRALVWELHDQCDQDEVLFTIDIDRKLFGMFPIKARFDLKWGHIAIGLTKLVGPREG